MNPAIQIITREVIEGKSIPEPNSGCWLWLQWLNQHGYGTLLSANKKWLAHRAAWVAYRGPIPDGLCVCHRCDVRSCVNPDHLFLGTNADNMADKIRKGRGTPVPRLRGSANASARLTEERAAAILSSSGTERFVAKQFGVSCTTVHFIRSGRAWAHLPRVSTATNTTRPARREKNKK